jgi:hypothetical protein
MAILKSRISKDGLVFENCIFNNEKMEFSTEQSETFLGFESTKSKRLVERAATLYKERIKKINITTTPDQQIPEPQIQETNQSEQPTNN